jgi:hypothetical protein
MAFSKARTQPILILRVKGIGRRSTKKCSNGIDPFEGGSLFFFHHALMRISSKQGLSHPAA